MQAIQLDASQWLTGLDFYAAILASLGSPDWHGQNVNALIDSMIYGGINAVKPPFRIQIDGLTTAGQDALDELQAALGFLAEEGAICMISAEAASIEINVSPYVD